MCRFLINFVGERYVELLFPCCVHDAVLSAGRLGTTIGLKGRHAPLNYFLPLFIVDWGWGCLLGIKRLTTRTDARYFSVDDISILVADANVDLTALALCQQLVASVATPIIFRWVGAFHENLLGFFLQRESLCSSKENCSKLELSGKVSVGYPGLSRRDRERE